MPASEIAAKKAEKKIVAADDGDEDD